MGQFRLLIVALGLLAVVGLVGGLALLERLWSELSVEYSEQSQIEDYLQLNAELSTLYGEYSRLATNDLDPQSAPDLEDLRRRVETLLLSLQSEISKRHGSDAAEREIIADANPEDVAERNELLDLAIAVGEFLTEIQDAEELIADGEREEAAALLRRQLDGSLARQLTPAIREAVARERTRVEATVLATERTLRIARWGLFAVSTAAIGLAVLLWMRVLIPHRHALLVLERRMNRLNAGEAIPADDVSDQTEFGTLSRSLKVASERQITLSEEISSLSARMAQQEARLRSEHEGLREMDRVRRDFLADVSHELRTPLTVLRGVAEVSLRGKSTGPDEFRKALDRIVSESIHVDRIVDDLFFIARSRAGGGMDLRTDIVDLKEVLSATGEQAHALSKQYGAEIAWSVPGEEILVEGDHVRLRQLFTILLDNALKYGGSNPKIEASVRTEGGNVVVVVRDHGPGVLTEDLPHVFDRLYRGAASSRAAPGGSGLGLPMARSIVEGHKGDIRMENAAGGGAQLNVSLPLFDEDAIEGETV